MIFSVSREYVVVRPTQDGEVRVFGGHDRHFALLALLSPGQRQVAELRAGLVGVVQPVGRHAWSPVGTFEENLHARRGHFHLGLLGFFYRQHSGVVAFLSRLALRERDFFVFLGLLEPRFERFCVAFELGEEVDLAI